MVFVWILYYPLIYYFLVNFASEGPKGISSSSSIAPSSSDKVCYFFFLDLSYYWRSKLPLTSFLHTYVHASIHTYKILLFTAFLHIVIEIKMCEPFVWYFPYAELYFSLILPQCYCMKWIIIVIHLNFLFIYSPQMSSSPTEFDALHELSRTHLLRNTGITDHIIL